MTVCAVKGCHNASDKKDKHSKITFHSECVCAGNTIEICKSRTRVLNDGDRFEPRRCFFCECRNKTLHCGDQEPALCPKPQCQDSVQISTSDRCCKICPGVGPRCRFNGMSVEDGEGFQLDPCGACECHNGKLTCSKECPSTGLLSPQALKFQNKS